MISLIEMWMLGIALAMDCFSVSTSSALAAKRFLPVPMTLMTASFGLFQGGMTLLGFLGASSFSQFFADYAHWIAFLLLVYLGGKMMLSSSEDEEKDAECKVDRLFSPAKIVMLSVATSIDALAVGISFACLDTTASWLTILQPVLIIAFCSSAFTVLGLSLGLSLGKRINWNAEFLGGLVLVGIGIKILVQHFLEA